nr:HNH endonuclease family protein [Campylobacter hominis]
MKEILNGNMYFNRVIKYLLFEYERYIQNKGYKIQDIEIKDASIEHISPKTPENGEQLAKGYDEHDENFVEEYLDNIGNLMVISQSQNSSIGNRPFREKLESYESNPLLNQQKEIKDFLIDGKIEWKRESINKRKEKIVNFALQNWDFDNIKF